MFEKYKFLDDKKIFNFKFRPMKKAILTALIISIMLIGCAIVEGSGSNSAEIDQAQQESVLKVYQSSETIQTAQE